jgi:hypothetical protein
MSGLVSLQEVSHNAGTVTSHSCKLDYSTARQQSPGEDLQLLSTHLNSLVLSYIRQNPDDQQPARSDSPKE